MAIHKIDGGPGGETPHYPKKFVPLYAPAAVAIAKGDWVRIDLNDTTNGFGQSVERAPMGTGGGDPLVFGVATHAITALSPGNLVVQTAGFYGHAAGSTDGAVAFPLGTGAALVSGTAAGVPLAAGSGGAVGEAMLYAGATHVLQNVMAWTVEAEGAGNYLALEAPVYILDQGLF